MSKVFVHVMPNYMPEESSSEKQRFVFSYTVSITNETLHQVQLLSRHWIITNGETLKTQEVRGDGVIGQKPIIQPGESYTYTSGTVMESPVGTMQGFYTMQDHEGAFFDVEIPVFTLAVTHSVH
ncbi:Co2+/Mg2+ efflux protein ApaG [Oceaniserpentilla sp. 4NH20-0058]|uniref:Co2+/Mg2+ efflux protein ApaG n=1 Tax=Oceaniserpentilla sp. 4NH20-0058 TaxID=3127660 RepID=UPI00310C1F5C